MNSKKVNKNNNMFSLIFDKQLYTMNYSLTYYEIFNFFFAINKVSIVEYNTKIVNSSIVKKSCQNNFFIKNFDKIELVTIIGGG